MTVSETAFVMAPLARGTSAKQDLEDTARFFGLSERPTGQLMVELTQTSPNTIDRALRGDCVLYRPHLHVVAEFVREARKYLFGVIDWADWTAQDAYDMRAWLDTGRIRMGDRDLAPREILTDESLARLALAELRRVTE